MPDYKLGKIYILQSPYTDEVYIGSTAQHLLCSRMSQHRDNAKNARDCSSKMIIDAGDAYIQLIEKYPCTDKQELNRREGQVALDYPTKVNKNVAGRTKKAWSQTPEAKAVAKAYYQSPAVIAIKSTREWKDKRNATDRALRAKKKEAKKEAALLMGPA